MDLLQRWTRAAERMTAGAEAAPGGAVNLNPDAPPTDTGEALGLPASVAHAHVRRRARASSTSWASARSGPPGSRRCRRSSCDQIDPALSGGDLCVQACANDPQVAVHAIRNLVRMGFGDHGGALVAARVRAHVVDVDEPGHAAQPVRLQGRHAQHQGRGHRPAARPRLGAARRRTRPGSRAAATWSPAGSGCTSRSGTAPRSPSRRASSGATRARVRPPGRRASSTSPTSAEPTATRAATRTSGWRGAEPRRGADPAARLQLRRRQRRAGPPQRGPVLPAYMRDPHDALRADAARAGGQGPADGVHRAHGLGGVRDPARAGRRRTTGARRSWRPSLCGTRCWSELLTAAGQWRFQASASRACGSAPSAAAACSAARTSSANARAAARSSASGSTPASLAAAASANSCSPTPGPEGSSSGGRPARAVRLISLAANATAGWPSATPSTLDVRCFSLALQLLPALLLALRGVHALGAREHVRVPSDELGDQVPRDVVDREAVLAPRRRRARGTAPAAGRRRAPRASRPGRPSRPRRTARSTPRRGTGAARRGSARRPTGSRPATAAGPSRQRRRAARRREPVRRPLATGGEHEARRLVRPGRRAARPGPTRRSAG